METGNSQQSMVYKQLFTEKVDLQQLKMYWHLYDTLTVKMIHLL